jgi:hypothetical protein
MAGVAQMDIKSNYSHREGGGSTPTLNFQNYTEWLKNNDPIKKIQGLD